MYSFTLSPLLFSYIYLSKNLGHLIYKVTNQERKRNDLSISFWTALLLLSCSQILSENLKIIFLQGPLLTSTRKYFLSADSTFRDEMSYLIGEMGKKNLAGCAQHLFFLLRVRCPSEFQFLPLSWPCQQAVVGSRNGGDVCPSTV